MKRRNKKKRKVRLIWPHLCHKGDVTIKLLKRKRKCTGSDQVAGRAHLSADAHTAGHGRCSAEHGEQRTDQQRKKEHFQFQEIGKRIMNGATEKGAEVAYHAALDRLAAQLIEDGACRIVDLYLEESELTENKNAAATYRYRVDCDGEWGEIHFDFENKKIKIQRLAEWDTTRSHKYAWKVIGLIALKRNKELPEKKRLIFWAGDIGQKKKRVLLQQGASKMRMCP